MFSSYFRKLSDPNDGKKSQDDFYYQAQICLRNSGHADTGHAAQVLTERRKSDGDVVAEHSLEVDADSALGTLVNGTTASVIPVRATATPLASRNCAWAPMLFTKEITKEQYDQGMEEQKKIIDVVDSGEMYYSVAANSAAASLIPNSMELFENAAKSSRRERQKFGAVAEDMADIPVLREEFMPEPDFNRTVNCVTSVAQTFAKAGIFKTGGDAIAPHTLRQVARDNEFKESDNPNYDSGFDATLRPTPQSF